MRAVALVGGLIGLGALLFLLEVGISAARGAPLHRWKDTLAALAMQASTGIVSHFGKAFLLLLYVPLLELLAARTWTGTWWEWALAFCAYDCVGYWFHRIAHRTNLGWAVHVVHHQSEELNLATAMRTAPLRSLLDWPTLLPLAVLGLPTSVLAVLYALHAAGQFWLHVRWIPALGPLEWVLNTPSAHRVHHGCQPGYQDANYGAHLIVWDRLFGTYVPETEAPVYGITRPTPGWDPLRSIVHPFVEVWQDARSWSLADRVRVWWKPPGWRPDGAVVSSAPPPRRRDFEVPSIPRAVAHTVASSLLLLSVPALRLPWPQALALALLGVASLRVQGLALESGPPPLRWELARVAATLVVGGWIGGPPGLALGALGIVLGGLAATSARGASGASRAPVAAR